MAKTTKTTKTTKATRATAPAPAPVAAPAPGGFIQLATRVEPGLHRDVKVVCATQGVKMQDAIASGLRLWLDSMSGQKRASK